MSGKEPLMSNQLIPADYASWFAELKTRIQRSRTQAALAVNQELVRLYHHIGSEILVRQGRQGWGAKVIDRLALDLRTAFPDMKGLSSSNLKYMRFFAELCPSLQIGQQPADQLPWFHIVTLLTKVADPDQREWYAIRAVERAWSRPTNRLPSTPSPASPSPWAWPNTSSCAPYPSPSTPACPPWSSWRKS
jgi:predicted nuclease of restriction endonuclease-like (RecB) superfamily